MSLLISSIQNLYAPEDSNSGSGGDTLTPLTSNSIEKMLEDSDDDDEAINLHEPAKKDSDKETSEEDPNKEDSDSDSGEDDGETEDDDLKDLEEELKEPDEDKLELVTPLRRREILAKYPNLFKDLPYLEKAYYREQQFTELFSTVEDAKRAASDVKTLDEFEANLGNGDIESLFNGLKGSSKEGFHKLVDNLLPTLARVDNESYNHIIENVGKQIIFELNKEGQKEGQDHLKNVALLVNQFMFGTSEWNPPGKLSKETPNNPEKTALEQEKKNFNQQRFTAARDELLTKIDNTLKSTINDNIDPKSSMTDYVKRNAVRDAQEKLENLIRGDARFKSILTKYWEKAAKSGYSSESMKELRSTYLTRAKALLPAVLKSARQEALRGLTGRKTSSEETEDNRPPKRGPIPNSGKSAASSNSGKSSSAKTIPPGMSIKDFLMAD